MKSVRALIADDHPVFREGLKALLAALPDIEVVGEAANGEEAVAAAVSLHPDVVVMDVHMPSMNGIEATRRIANAAPKIGVLILTMVEDDDSVFAALRAGARGYVLKGADHLEVMRAVEAVARGEAIFGPSIAERIVSYFASAPAVTRSRSFPQLTDREREVLELIAAGRPNQTIARQLVVSEKTVRNHVSNIFSKLHVADRAEAIVRAREAGLGGTTGDPGVPEA